MPHREGHRSPSTAESSDHDQAVCQPSPISSFDSHDASEKVEKERGRATRRRSNRARSNRGGTNRLSFRQLLEVVRARASQEPIPHEGRKKGDWIEYDVAPSQYLRIRDELELVTIRHDYDPVRSLLILRMPTRVHDIFSALLGNKIHDWLRELQAVRLPRAVREIISNITPGRNSDCEIPVTQDSNTAPRPKQRVDSSHSPDDQYLYVGSKDPPFIIEIGYSQQAEDLAGLAKQYYEGAAIKTVLTVNLEYIPKAERKSRRREESAQSSQRQTRPVFQREEKTSAASFCLYRGPERVVFDRMFRDQAGNHVQNEGLTLYLSDFVPDAVLDTLPQKRLQPDPALHITPLDLFNFLVRGELLQKLRDTTRTPSPMPQPGKQKKRKVNWASEADEDEDEDKDEDKNKDSDEQEAPATKRLRSASSKRRRLSDTAFSTSSRPSSALPLMQTRSRSRGRQGPPSG